MAQVRIKKAPFAVLILAVVGIFGLRYAYNNGYLSAASSGPAVVPTVAALPTDTAVVVPQAVVPILPLPSTAPAAVQGPKLRALGMAWNAQASLALANGGPETTQGSLMEKNGVNLTFTRQDDCMEMQTQLIAFAKSLHDGNPQPTEGANFVAVMGDGSAAFIEGMRAELEKLGPEYMAEVFGSTGFSRGEDALWGPAAWKQNPKLMRGAVIAGYLRDGDWNIALKYAADNNIKNNPDEHTYDPDAINWYAADDFLKAADAYINGITEERPVVRDGKRTGERKTVAINAVVTWTPGDVNIATQKGGLVPVVGTREYRNQMPNTIIGIKKWNQANRKLVKKFLSAMYDAGDQIKANPAALTRASQAQAVIYHDQDAAYWERYFKGVVETDKTGVPVQLGGSSVNNLQDAARLYGLLPGSANLFAATYTVFGNLVHQQYPKLVSSFPPVETILNTSYTQELLAEQAASGAPVVAAEAPVFVATTEIKQVVSSRNWPINFESGSAAFAPSSMPQLEELKNGLLNSEDLGIEIHGHTDSTGDPAKNQVLSQLRANAVRDWLMQQGSSNFPRDRFIKVEGHGSDMPAATNDTETGRAKNRRVVVILGH